MNKYFLQKIFFILIILAVNQGFKSQDDFDYNKYFETIKHQNEDTLAYVLYDKAKDLFHSDSLLASKIVISKAFDYSEKFTDPLLVGRSYILLGEICNDLLEFFNSREAFYEALRISKETRDSSLMLYAMHSIENYYYQMQEMDSAVSYCAKSIAISKAFGAYADLSDSYRSLCTYLAPSNEGVLNSSFLIDGLMDSCLLAAGKASNPSVLVYALANYGLDYYDKSPQKAFQYLQAAIDSARNLPDPSSGLIYALTKSSEAYFRNDQFDYSRTLMDEALPLADSVGDYQQQIHLHYLYGRYYDEKDSIVLALENYKEAIFLAEKYRYTYYLSFIYHNLFQYYFNRNLLDSSYLYQKKYMDVTNREHDQEMSLQIARLSAKFQIDQKMEAIDNLTVLSSQKQIIIRNQRRFILSLVFGILVGVFLFMILLFQFRRIRMAHRKLAKNALELSKKNKQIADLKLKKENKLELVYDDLKIRLIELIEKDEIFLNKDLSLSKTALMLKTNTSYLSAIINKEYSCKFNQFINKYRVAKACELMANPELNIYSIEGIADLAGFKSKSVFNLEFKEATGVQPSVYRKSIIKDQIE